MHRKSNGENQIMSRFWQIAGIGLIGALWAATSTASDVHSYELNNGMKILIKEDRRAPVVASMVWYKVGGSYEPSGLTGISHVLEHMMFKGTEKHPPGEFSRIIAANGGRENAFTGRDYTAYFQQLEAGRLEISFEMEADRMRNMKVLDEEFAKEVQVVMEERRLRTEDRPTSLTYERFNAAAYVTSPYHNPIVGWMDDLENMTADDIRQWYNKWYAPNNATLVVVGDIDPQATFELAKEYFGPLKADEIATTKPRREIEQKGERRIRVKTPAELPYLLMGYKTPNYTSAEQSWEPYALAVLSSIMDGGASARFARDLVRGKQVAASVGASYDAFTRLDNMFLFDGKPAQGRTMEELENAIRDQIEQLQETLVSDAELSRVKAQVIAGDVYQKDSIFYQAMELGMLTAIGLDWRLGETYAQRINEVTAEQVREVARKYLIEDRLTVAVLDPLPIDTAQPRPAASTGGRH